MVYRGIVKFALNTLAILLFLLMAVVLALHHPGLQTKVAKKIAKGLSERIDLPVEIGYVNLKWYDELYVEQLTIKDVNSDELIHIDKLTLNFSLSGLFSKNETHIDKAEIYGARVALSNDSPDQTMNISHFVRKVKKVLSSGTEKNPKIFSVSAITLEQSQFSLNNITKDSVSDRWDPNHFHLTSIWGDLSDLRINKDTFEININHLECVDRQSKLTVHDLQTFYRICNSSMTMKDMELNIGSSRIVNNLAFYYDSIQNLSDFNYLVDLNVELRESEVHSKDLAWFVPVFNQYDQRFSLKGSFDGMISRFSFDDFSLAWGASSELNGSLNITGLPNWEEAFIDVDLNQSFLSAVDCRDFLSDELFRAARQVDYIEANGVLTGFLYDFVANGSFVTALGAIDSDINLKISENKALSTYSGKLAVRDFNLGRFLDNEKLIQKVDMVGEIEGKGLSIETADFKLKALFNYFDFKNYRYQHIQTDARLAKELFIGNLNIDDQNLQLEANALINLREDKNRIDLTGRLDTAFFQNLNLTGENIFASADFDLDITGLKIDSILGELNINDVLIAYNDREMRLDHLELISEISDSDRIFYANSDLFSVSLNGDFSYTRLINDIQNQYHEYKLSIRNDREAIGKYYDGKQGLQSTGDYYVKYDANLKNINPVIQLFSPTAFISGNTRIEGVLTGGYTRLITFYSSVDTINYKGYAFHENLIDIRLSKNIDNAYVDASADIESGKQFINHIQRTKDLHTNLLWKGKQLDFQINMDQSGSENYVRLIGGMNFLDTLTRLTIDSSKIKIIDEVWTFNEDNETLIRGDEISLNHIRLYNGDRSITATGLITPDTVNGKVTINIQNVALEDLNPVLKNDLYGAVNGNVRLSNFYGGLIFESELRIDSFMIKRFPVGDILAQSYWENQTKQLNVGIDIKRENEKIIAVSGYVDPTKDEDQLHLYAYFDKASLNIAEPFVENYFSNISGHASGEFLIKGAIRQPVLEGVGIVENGRVRVNYLNTTYTFNGDLTFESNRIGVENLIVRDNEFNQAVFSGGFYHSGLKNFVMDITGDLNDFKVLNTTAKDNDLYYGTAVVNGRVNFLGAPSNLNISANAVTRRGTRIFIPLDGSETIEQENFIQFITESEQKEDVSGEISKIDLRGLKMELDLEVTPEAYCELIFDIKAGDIIRGRGSGDIKLEIDTHGEFTMFGDVGIHEGGYNFTLYNVINKEFNILPNSTISWTGDPYKAQMDIQAEYEQMASLSPLLDSTLWSEPEVRRKYPAKVLLDLQGDLMSPNINFNIEVDDYPYVIYTDAGSFSMETAMSAFKNKLRADEQELKRQVFSLMVLRRFSPENSFDVSGSVGKSVSEFISNQLSYWVTQFDENLEIDVDLGSLDQEAFNTFQLRLSYTLMDGRLRITRDGGFTNQQNQASFTSIAGDWTVEYLLTPNGKLRAKMYNKTNYNLYDRNNLNNPSATTAGFSLMHTESFDTIKEIFRQARERSTEDETEEIPKADALKKEDNLSPQSIN